MRRPPLHKSIVVGTVLFLCVFSPFTARSSEEIRTFSDTLGRSFEGMLMDFDWASKIASIKRADGKTGKMPLAKFSDEDRQYIREWGLSNEFMNGIDISAQLQYIEVSSQDSGFFDMTKQVGDFHYYVKLTNPSSASFGKIDIEYCIFYRQGTRDGSTVTYDEGTCHCKDTLAALKPLSAGKLETKTIRLYSEKGHQTLFGSSELSDANVRGIWIRLKTKLPSGKEILREYRTDDGDKWEWRDYSIGAGVNKGDSETRYYLAE